MAITRNIALLAVALISLPAEAVRSDSPENRIPSLDTHETMIPPSFLIITSPSEKKIVWTMLKDFTSTDIRVFPLITSGLVEPKGCAFDHNNGVMYVADTGLKSIFRYRVLVDESSSVARLVTVGDRLLVLRGHAVEWVTVDAAGNVLFTDPVSQNINMLTKEVIDDIELGTFHASDLQLVDEKTIEAKQMARHSMAQISPDGKGLPTKDLPHEPYIYSLYQASINPHVAKPAALKVHGSDLYWVNQANGTNAGTVVKGEVNPPVVLGKHGPEPFPAVALTNASNGAYGMTIAHGHLMYTQNGTIEGTGLVTAVKLTDPDITIDIETSLSKPRGMTFDGDQTVYVADEALGQIWSFPSGRIMSEAPLRLTAEIAGAYGLILVSATDPCFRKEVIHNEAMADGKEAQSHLSDARALSTLDMKDTVSLLETHYGASFLQRSSSSGVQLCLPILLMLALVV